MTSLLLSFVFGAFDDPRGRGRHDRQPEAGRHQRTGQPSEDHQGPKAVSANDVELVERIRNGESAAFEQLYASTFESLWQFAAALLRERTSAEDLVQDVFLDLWKRRATWAVGDSVRGYLFGAVRHRIGTLRHRVALGRQATLRITENIDTGRDSVIPATYAATTPDITVEEHDTATRIRRVVNELPERQRTAVLLRWLGDLNAAEIGRHLGISDTAARKLLLKAERKLRIQLGKLLG